MGGREPPVLKDLFGSRGFPKLTPSNAYETSEVDASYNCIAWAAGKGAEEAEFWWPDPLDVSCTWPLVVSEELELCVEMFVQAFQTLGYEPCDGGNAEQGWEKVVLYVNEKNEPTHMARQLADGSWTSKLGKNVDIHHSTVEAVEGPWYGKATQYLRRRKS